MGEGKNDDEEKGIKIVDRRSSTKQDSPPDATEKKVHREGNGPKCDAKIPEQNQYGERFCPDCKKWVKPEDWSYAICLSCSLDQGTEISDFLEKREKE